MKRLAVLMVGALMLGAPLLVSGPSAFARTDARAAVAGTYNGFYNFGSGKYQPFSLTLSANHTGSAFGDPLTWSVSGKTITMVLTNPMNPSQKATYVGAKRSTGFSSKRHPGTWSANTGTSGFWYAVRAG